MTKYEFKTMAELEQFTYGYGAQIIQKTDAPMLTTTSGIYNAIYGKKVWSWLNQEANVFAILPKKPWNQSGWRVMTARAASSGGGVAENSSLPDTIMPTYAELSTKPKEIVHTFDMSEMQQVSAKSDDGIGFDQLRQDMGVHHAEMMNIMLLTQSGTTASNNLESIDRVCSTYSEDTSCTENDLDTSFTAGDNDIYSQDRDASTTADSNCLHNSGALRPFSLSLVNELIENVLTYGPADPGQRVFITGYDTLREWSEALEGQSRFMEVKNVALSVNGVKTVPGQEAGFTVNSYMGIPIIPSKNVVVDTTDHSSDGGISRIYLLDLNHIHLRVAKPTQYFQAGISAGNPFGINKVHDEGMYRTMAELICTDFKAHGKIRDLSEV